MAVEIKLHLDKTYIDSKLENLPKRMYKVISKIQELDSKFTVYRKFITIPYLVVFTRNIPVYTILYQPVPDIDSLYYVDSRDAMNNIRADNEYQTTVYLDGLLRGLQANNRL